jgi:tetratricopeptide (TPR) repeat protein
VVILVASSHPFADPLTAADRLSVAYGHMLNARFDRAEQELATACGPAPPEACAVLRAANVWWRILLNPNDTRYDTEFSSRVDRAIDACEVWTEREPRRAEAWFYLGGAYGARVSWRVQRGERVAAARDGKRIKEALERALALDPSLDDARFGVGLYKYYADVAPAVAKFLRFLLLLPGGDRVAGLKDMEAVHSRGVLLRGEADYQLHWVYLYYENQPRRALALAEALHTRYPANPHFVERIADTEEHYLHDAAAGLRWWQQMVDHASDMADPQVADTNGRLGAARMLDLLYETDRAIDLLQPVVAAAPTVPYGAGSRAQLLMGHLRDRIGDRARAITAYRAAIDLVPSDDPDNIEAAAHVALRRGPPAVESEAYRLSLLGWRAFERGAHDEAATMLARAVAQSPNDLMIRVREARVRAARGDLAGALASFDAVIAMRPRVPAVALGSAYLWSAELLEHQRNSTAALERYRAVPRVFGTDSRLIAAANVALARLGGSR